MKARAPRNRESSHAGRSRNNGFTLLQVIVVLAVGMILSAAAVMSIRAGRPGLQLANSAHQFAGYMERARADSVRRRATSGNESGIQILNTTTYRVTMGFGGSDTLTSRDFPLEGDVVFTTNLTTVKFDWRGRPTTGGEITFAFQNSAGTTQVDVTGSGDVTVGSEIFQDAAVPNVNLNSNVSGDVAPDPPNPNSTPTPEPTATPTPTPGTQDPTPTPTPGTTDPTPTPTPGPTDPPPTPTPRPTATPSPTPLPSPSPSPIATPTPCVPAVSPSSISVRKAGGSSSVTVNLGGGSGAISAAGPTNLTISPDSATIATSGSAAFTITSNNNTRGDFTVTFTTPCGQVNLIVSVTN
jgi:Tfp pilus assembly protein FimT